MYCVPSCFSSFFVVCACVVFSFCFFFICAVVAARIRSDDLRCCSTQQYTNTNKESPFSSMTAKFKIDKIKGDSEKNEKRAHQIFYVPSVHSRLEVVYVFNLNSFEQSISQWSLYTFILYRLNSTSTYFQLHIIHTSSLHTEHIFFSVFITFDTIIEMKLFVSIGLQFFFV